MLVGESSLFALICKWVIVYAVDLMVKIPYFFGVLMLIGIVTPSSGGARLAAVLGSRLVLQPLFLLLLKSHLLRLLLLACWLVVFAL